MTAPESDRFESIRSLTEAVARMIDGSGIPLKAMAPRLGVGYRHLQRMLNADDQLNFQPDLIELAMRECKSVLPLEWLAWRMGYALHEQSLTSVLGAIRDALVAEGKAVKFIVHPSGRVERG